MAVTASVVNAIAVFMFVIFVIYFFVSVTLTLVPSTVLVRPYVHFFTFRIRSTVGSDPWVTPLLELPS